MLRRSAASKVSYSLRVQSALIAPSKVPGSNASEAPYSAASKVRHSEASKVLDSVASNR
jgi:hypothetical protein